MRTVDEYIAKEKNNAKQYIEKNLHTVLAVYKDNLDWKPKRRLAIFEDLSEAALYKEILEQEYEDLVLPYILYLDNVKQAENRIGDLLKYHL